MKAPALTFNISQALANLITMLHFTDVARHLVFWVPRMGGLRLEIGEQWSASRAEGTQK